jgi:hypothetical protein
MYHPKMVDSEEVSATSLADFVESIRPKRETPGSDAVPASLRDVLVDGLEVCVRDFEHESDQVIDRRRHVGALLVGATSEEEQGAADFLGERLGLRVIEIDVASLENLPDEAVLKHLATLAEPTAHIVVLRGLRTDADRRVLEAIEWSDVDVLVLGTAEAEINFESGGVRRRLRHRIPKRAGAGAWSFAGVTFRR